MHRLSFRTSWPLFVAVVLCFCGLCYGLPKIFPGATLEVPLLPLLIIELGLGLSAALLFYDEASPFQAVKLSLVILVFVAAFSALAHFANNELFSEIRLRGGSQAPVLTINWVFLLTVNLAAISVAKALIVLNTGLPGARKRAESSSSDR